MSVTAATKHTALGTELYALCAKCGNLTLWTYTVDGSELCTACARKHVPASQLIALRKAVHDDLHDNYSDLRALDASALTSHRRRLAMACGCRETVSDPVSGARGVIEATEERSGTLWAALGDEHGVSLVPAARVVLPPRRPCTPPPPRPDSEPPAIPRHGELRVTECTVPGWGRVEMPSELRGKETVRP